MSEPRPSQFGFTKEQVDALNSQINALEAQLAEPTVVGEDYTNAASLYVAAIAWAIYVLGGKAPTTSGKVGAGIVAYFLSLIWITLGQKLLFKSHSRKVSLALAELRNSPLNAKLTKYREAHEHYVQERKKAQEEWDRWQKEWSNEKTSYWLSLDGIPFERELANLYKALGYEASLTSLSNDDGVDINLKKGSKYTIVQCKAHHKPVGKAAVIQLLGSLHDSRADEAVLACPSGFTSGAIKFAKKHHIKLIKLDDILKMQASLLREMPTPLRLSNYSSESSLSYSTHRSLNTSIPAPTISRQQHVWSLALSSIVGIGIVLGYVLFTKADSAPIGVPQKKLFISTTPTPFLYGTTPKPRITPSPTPSASIEKEAADIEKPLEYKESPSIALSLPSSTPVLKINQNSSDTPHPNSNTSSTQTIDKVMTPTPVSFPSHRNLSGDDQRRITAANDLSRLGVSVDWRAYTWLELYDIERRVRQAADLQQFGLSVDWRNHTWSEMYDWERRMREAEDLRRLGLTVNWRDHTWMEMYDWERRIRQAKDLEKYGIYVDWRKYTWFQMYDMEQKARR